MRPSRPGGFLKTPPPRQVTPTPRPPASPLKILVAGVDKDARYAVEATIRQAFSRRDPSEPWSVSLVRLGSAWSVTLSGPGERYRNVSFVAEQYRLADALREAIAEDYAVAGPTPGPAGSQVAGSGRVRIEDRHVCGKCQRALVVSYEADPQEPKERAPVACPHCWAVSHVDIGGWAAAGGDYFAAKA